ncbi:uncharacterized protein LOC126855532 [Cataglyphis hispanica]|uniref:uncharacterized protein LOC126855532 n=1 Tax=Cataglyphis hispanica TaxID=1086592 RepID=UPI00217FDB81|nr:uncharacterized protein LOC126855532 [Cataglyphis hispanica]
MDVRTKNICDFVAEFRNLTEDTKKSRLKRMKWFAQYEPLLKEYEKLQQELNKLYEERIAKDKVKEDAFIEKERTCLPIPITTSGEYGWLASKAEFRLEKYGSFIVNYPIKDITLIRGNIPTLAAGKNFV